MRERTIEGPVLALDRPGRHFHSGEQCTWCPRTTSRRRVVPTADGGVARPVAGAPCANGVAPALLACTEDGRMTRRLAGAIHRSVVAPALLQDTANLVTVYGRYVQPAPSRIPLLLIPRRPYPCFLSLGRSPDGAVSVKVTRLSTRVACPAAVAFPTCLHSNATTCDRAYDVRTREIVDVHDPDDVPKAQEMKMRFSQLAVRTLSYSAGRTRIMMS